MREDVDIEDVEPITQRGVFTEVCFDFGVQFIFGTFCSFFMIYKNYKSLNDKKNAKRVFYFIIIYFMIYSIIYLVINHETFEPISFGIYFVLNSIFYFSTRFYFYENQNEKIVKHIENGGPLIGSGKIVLLWISGFFIAYVLPLILFFIKHTISFLRATSLVLKGVS
ncbi:MAG: hypothetical protein LBH07_06600 [Treponema sp.]|nr:hypothetical protein [Treponema sp.]